MCILQNIYHNLLYISRIFLYYIFISAFLWKMLDFLLIVEFLYSILAFYKKSILYK